MTKIVKKFLRALFFKVVPAPILNLGFFTLYLLFQSKNTGLFKSAKLNRPVNNLGQPIPWLTHGCINFFASLDLKRLSMVEIGCGNSTIWYSEKVLQITSYEPDIFWIEEMNKLGYKGKIVHHKNDHVFSIEELKADIILIDGHDRISILETIVKGINSSELSPQFIIIDNSNWFPLCISSALKLIDYIKIDFVGTVSALSNESLTTVLISRNVDKEVFANFELFGFESLSKKRMGRAGYDRHIGL